jgi:hypothetical protein
MGSLYETNDNHTQERANRVSIAARYKLPLFDVDDAGAVTVPFVTTQNAITQTLTPLFTATLTVALVESITLVNLTSSAVPVGVQMNAPGNPSTYAGYLIFKDTLQPFETVQIDVPFHLALNGTVYAYAVGVDNAVHGHVNGIQFVTQPAGCNLQVIECAVAQPATTVVYTCPAGVRQAVVLAVSLVNTAAAAVQVGVVMSGAYIFHAVMEPGETAFAEPGKLLAPGYQLAVFGLTADVIVARPTILEVI